ncbi:hypothetical protein NLG97_g3596 [Lecanicillium saksenae]|uniref:Uncharacterized protein n=1 Tax=Lecanicillium saksenae TaxID=468837 RepID=A0ACC1QZI9_9HYPO|nr:hypothetical protein NLG97_g3596 [Lecanicillium saksenae]
MSIDEYDALGDSYNLINRLPYREIERRSVEATIKPLIHEASSVLELACGTAYYSVKILAWGAKSLTSLDISDAMVKLASKALADDVASGRATVQAADATQVQPLSPSGEPASFDVAFAAWLLNYVSDRESLTVMFRNIALNLKPGGVFVGVVPHPTDDLTERAAEYRGGPFTKLLPRNEYTSEMGSGDGWGLRVHLSGKVNFMTYHMKKQVYEEAARRAGMNGRLEWRPEVIEEDIDRDSSGLSEAEWPAREATPHFGVLFLDLLLGEFMDVHSRRDAYTLCLVNRAFNAVFSKALYHAVTLKENTDNTAGSLLQMQQVASCSHFIATKGLEIVFLSADDIQLAPPDDNIKAFRAFIPTLFSKMLNLLHLHCTNYASFDEDWMQNMQDLPLLESLVLENMFLYEQEPLLEAAANRKHNPAQFRSSASFSRLKSLQLLKIQKGILDWAEYIVSFMLNAIRLEALKVTLYYEVCDSMMDKVCQAYAARAGGRLVPVKHMELGMQLHLPKAGLLGSAFDLLALETIDVNDCDSALALGSGVVIVEPDVWEVLDPAVTPNLRRITISELLHRNFDKVTGITQGREYFGANNTGWPDYRSVHELARLSRAPQLRIDENQETNNPETWGNLRNCHWITHLSICLNLNEHEYDETTKPPLLEWFRDALPPYCEILATMTQLKLLQIDLQTPKEIMENSVEENHRTLAKILATACPTLLHIDVDYMTFAITWPTLEPDSTEGLELEPELEYLSVCDKIGEDAKFLFPCVAEESEKSYKR